jgi:hypothetical protein
MGWRRGGSTNLAGFFPGRCSIRGRRGPCHGEEGFQDVAGQIPVHVVGRVVGHQIYDKMVSNWRHKSCERLIEEI